MKELDPLWFFFSKNSQFLDILNKLVEELGQE